MLYPPCVFTLCLSGPKAVRRFIHLMQNRINWDKSATNTMDEDETAAAEGRNADEMSDDEQEKETTRDFGPAKLVWQVSAAYHVIHSGEKRAIMWMSCHARC